jgi:protein ImuB
MVVPPGGTLAMLKPLPLAALRLDRETVSALDRVGLKRIGQIVEAPRGPLAARFGAMLIRRLDQALGREEEAISPRRPVPALTAERRFAEPIGREEDIAASLASLAETLRGSLEAQGLGARLLELSLFRVDGAVARLTVGASRPIRAPKLILDLFREKLAGLGEAIDAGFGFDMVRLAVPVAAPADPAQIDLAGDAVAAADLDGLIDRIGARIGPSYVARMVTRESHIPERAESQVSGAAAEPRATSAIRRAPDPPSADDPVAEPIDRPLRLFARPEPVEAIAEVPDGPPVHFRWRRVLYRIARAEGPERIAPEWWHNDDLTRDYFRVEDVAGHRFWLFREGLYERETATPRWYLHGVFA